MSDSYVTTGDSWDGPGHNQVTALGLTVSLGLQRLLSVGLWLSSATGSFPAGPCGTASPRGSSSAHRYPGTVENYSLHGVRCVVWENDAEAHG